MAQNTLRLEQFDTVLYNANLNPMGIPDSVKKAISENAEAVIRYPSDYYADLKKAISSYAGCKESNILFGNGSNDMLSTIVRLKKPERALLVSPCATDYEKVLATFDCEIDYYDLKEENDFVLDYLDFAQNLNSSYDIVVLGNPNNPTSQIISKEDMETIAEVCNALDILLVIDEMYMEFVDKYESFTSVPLVESFDNIVVTRSVSKFFAVPGIRFSYAITNNTELLDKYKKFVSPINIPSLTAIACTKMLADKEYIETSNTQIFTERNLIFSAMSPSKTVKLFKPQANFMLVKLLKDDVTADQIAEHCKTKGIIIRNCENFRGLDNKYIRFCFMKPSQNDMLVNTILELL